ncbi:hypothetical protein AX16_010504 [Volvariella volvacea WC 439]|nr:hypothetical protein AX16_010504 [Volvariella volvacea WC 439]
MENTSFKVDHPLVFTHGDFLPCNLILNNSGRVWVVDWQLAGWYPAYLKYACILDDMGNWEYPTLQDWKNAVLLCLPDHQVEYSLLKSIKGVLKRCSPNGKP